MKMLAISLLLFCILVQTMGKRVAGLVIFRQSNSEIEYLMLKPSKDRKNWSPPKGTYLKRKNK